MDTNIDDVEKQLDIIFNELFGVDFSGSKITTKEPTCLKMKPEDKDENSATIYDILNLVPGSRKTLNILFQKSNDLHDPVKVVNSGEYGINKSLLQKCFYVSDVWEEEEKRSKFSTLSSNISLHVESPITFAWSNKNSKDIVNEVIQKQEKQDKLKEIQSSIRLPAVLSNFKKDKSINETLLKEVSDNLIELIKHTRSWNYILHGTEQQETSDLQKLDNDYSNGESITDQRLENSKTNFQVDPLEIFVATSLPRVKNNLSTKNESKKAKHKSKSLWWIWSGSFKRNHKNKEKDNSENKQSDKANASVETITNLDCNNNTMNHTIPSVENGRDASCTVSMNLDKTPEDELNFDLNNHSFRGLNDLSSMNMAKEGSSYLNITTNNVEKNDCKSADINDIDLLSENIENIKTESTNLQNDSSDDDDDFGDFEENDTSIFMSQQNYIFMLNNTKDNAASLLDDNDVSINLTDTPTNKSTSPSMMSFVPLQPQKRS